MHDRRVAARHWSTYLLVLACVGALVAAVLVVGPSTSASGTSERIVTVAQGVVQSTVSGSGSVEAAQQLDVNFETAGTLTHVYVKPGQHVVEGQALAAIDPADAQATLDQAEASLAAAEAGGSGGSSGSSGSGGGSGSSASTASTGTATATTAALTTPTTTPTTPAATTPTTTTPAPARTTPAPAKTTPSNTTAGGGSGGRSSTGSRGGTSGAGGSGSSSSGGSGGSSSGETAAQKAANVASAQAAVDKAETALAATTLHAPIGGTVASIGAAVGEQVSGGGSSSASSSASSSGSGSGSSSGSGGSGSGSGSGSGGSGSGSSAFIVLADLDALNVVVPFSESDVGKLRVGQPATVSVNALPNQQLAAHVVSIATLPTSSSGVVSYDVTLRLDQLTPGLKSGMTASAQVVVERVGDALNVASAAISGRGANASVDLVQGGKRVRTPVVTGVVGDSTTQILGGVRAGDQVAIVTQLPSASSAASGLGGAATGTRAGAFGGGGGGRFGGGGGGFGGGGGIAVGGGGGPP